MDLRVPRSDGLPKTLIQAWATFLSHKTPRTVLCLCLALLLYRLQESPVSWADLPVACGAVCVWLAQEWAIHAKLLHSKAAWFGRDLHEQHHSTQYFHVCIDGVELVAPVMLLALGVFSAAFYSAPALGHTASLSYWAAGLGYLWTHYFVHLPVPTSSCWAKAVRRHHMLHHCRSEEYWLAFCVPAVDAIFNTLPASASAVSVTPLAARQKDRMRGKADTALPAL
ncbi:hypothetical protein WJX81_004879 [Elliptochloris bilobata]|uniref:Fatty acid hydroxylase domain-containing protein n=1 Tax=Elliptochloris bilobata TaxID=381761 RepID=A0AAW1SJ78_9CHLO